MNKYLTIYNQIKSQIKSGIYKSGQKLPSKRVLAERNGVSVITVEKAYATLYEEGYVYSEEKKGYFVSEIDLLFGMGEEKPISIEYVKEPLCEYKLDFEHGLWFKTVRKVISEKADELFIKSPSKGCAILRNAISEYLQKCRNMIAPPKNVLIGSGAEQLYETVVKLLGRDKIYAIEDPSYQKIYDVYNGLGATVKLLKMGSDGIETDWLKKQKFDILHVTPFNSFPSGITTSASKKYEYLKFAEQKNLYILEDDFASEFYTRGKPIESLYSLDNNNRVIYVNTFSLSLSPSMRMGYMILPDALLEKYDKILGGFSCTVPVMEQYVLAEFIKNGSFERHLNRARRKLQKKKTT